MGFTRLGYGASSHEVNVADNETTRLDVVLLPAPISVERLVVVGSRAHSRTAAESMVPIDVVPVTDLARQGDTDLSTLLRNVVPSYNVTSEPISDAASISRPASIRNLAPDHTLVLVNGKRRHRSAVIVLFGGNGVADGAQAPDIATLPAIAMSQVEVLRDGASAQYGSDAIAGVINFVPKSNRSGGTLEVRGGRFDEGDGDMYSVAGNIGLPLGETGFLSVSGEFGQAEPTSRSVQRDDAAALAALGVPVRDPAQIWGLPEVDNNVKLFANMGYTFDGGVEAYAHGNYHTKSVTGGFYFRNPNTRDAVFSIDGGETLLIGDLLDARRRRTGWFRQLPGGPHRQQCPGPGRAAAGPGRPELLHLPGVVPGRLHAPVRRGRLRPVGGGRGARLRGRCGMGPEHGLGDPTRSTSS